MSTELTKYKIIGHFGPAGTKVINQDTGEEIKQVRSVIWMHEAGSAPRCFIELVGGVLEAEGQFADASTMDSGLYRIWQRVTGKTKK